jgi:hypothetical protein
MTRRNNRRNNKQPKLKNNQIIRKQYDFVAGTGDFRSYVELINNPNNLNTDVTGYVQTIGRFSIDCTLEGTNGDLNNVALFVMYIPEGYSMYVNNSVVDVASQHPEWIMAYKYLGSPTDSQYGQGCQPTRITSRVRRNLMTGDRVILFVSGTNSGNASITGIIWAYLKFASRIN